MKRLVIVLLLLTAVSRAQEASDFHPAETNVWGADFPKVDSAGRVEIRLKAPEATKVRLNFWSGRKVDMEKQPDGFWTVMTPPLVPGLHYYTLIIDGAEVSDTNSRAFFGGGKYASMVEVPEPGSTYYSIQDVPHGQVREVWYNSKVTGTWRHALVYLPPDYDTQIKARYPVHVARFRSPSDRKTTRLNSSHQIISYAVFCLKKKKNENKTRTATSKQSSLQTRSRLTPIQRSQLHKKCDDFNTYTCPTYPRCHVTRIAVHAKT